MNILVIDIDTLRADRLGCYGYPKPTSPAIDRLAAEGVLFENCIANGIPTTPAHTTLYAGVHPLTHNIVCHGGSVDLDRKTPVLPELLQKAGYTTCAVDNLFDLKPWLARGYEFYVNPSHRHNLRLLVSCEEINRRAIPWLKAHAGERFFLWLHYWEPHTPYLPPERYRTFYDGGDPFDPANKSLEAMKRQPFWGMFADTWFKKLGNPTDAAYVASLYDGEIRHADDGVAQILDALDETGLAEETLVILLADHGEVLHARDIFFDHHGLYDDNLRTPLILRAPGRLPAGTRVAPMAQHIDLLPTLLSWAGAAIPGHVEGDSLLPLATGERAEGFADRVVSCECTWQAKWALRTARHKFILAREPDRHGMPMRELYDLQADPGETHNLADPLPELAAEYETWLENWIAAGLAKTGRTEDPLRAQGITLGKRWESYAPPAGA